MSFPFPDLLRSPATLDRDDPVTGLDWSALLARMNTAQIVASASIAANNASTASSFAPRAARALAGFGGAHFRHIGDGAYSGGTYPVNPMPSADRKAVAAMITPAPTLHVSASED